MNKALIIIFLLMAAISQAQQTPVLQAAAPDTTVRVAPVVNNNPVSEVDIPVSINLRPIYAWANKIVDTLYTSPNYPNDWVQDGCDIRYQYRFVRGPMQFKAANNALAVTFSGFYGVRGSTRLCTGLGNSPWTPSCSCGFGTEKPRRIDVSFSIRFSISPDYKLAVQVSRTEPVAVDKCEVCFFGKDITKMVSAQLKAELDASFADMQKMLSIFSVRSYMQRVWDTLQTPYRIPGFGYLSMQPEALRLSQVALQRDSLFLSLGLSARPELKMQPEGIRRQLPNVTDFSQRSGFKLFVAQTLPYDSLNTVLNSQLAGREFQVGKGMLKKTIRIDSARLIGGGRRAYMQVHTSKGVRGTFYLQGKPVYEQSNQMLSLDSLDFHVDSKQVLLKSAAWALDGVITSKLKEYTRFSLVEKADSMRVALRDQMNRTIYTGVQSKGNIEKLAIERLEALEQGIFMAGNAAGKLWIDVDAGQLIGAMLR